jgi:hypothetical protein
VPPRCPECGRFLSKDFIQGLLDEPAPCPRCEETLTADHFHGSDPLVHAQEPLAESVRPPDLPPTEVLPPEDRDVLAGWDEEVGYQGERARQTVAAPLGAAAAIVGAGVAGGLIGSAISRKHRSAGAVVGTLAGAVAAIIGARALEVPFIHDR